MEQSFGERLKNYRRAKNLTQQELADMLGVSNKTVSRWESGGYPDLGMLVPLARALGVTVDDLLDDEKPIRTLTQADWQNFLSFAFSLGGGVLFFLLDLFMPVVLCYLAYLMCMIYGVYLQRHYCYQTKWFRIANGVMNLSVNISFSYRCVTALAALSALAPSLYSWDFLMRLAGMAHYYLGGIQLGGFLLALLITGLTLYLVEKKSPLPKKHSAGVGTELCFRRPPAWELIPALFAVVLGGFFFLYNSTALPLWVYHAQANFYHLLLAALVVLCVILCLRKSLRGLVPTALLGVGGLILKQLGSPLMYRTDFQSFTAASKVLQHKAANAPDTYWLYYGGNTATALAMLLLATLCVAVCCVGLRPKTPLAPNETDA